MPPLTANSTDIKMAANGDLSPSAPDTSEVEAPEAAAESPTMRPDSLEVQDDDDVMIEMTETSPLTDNKVWCVCLR